MQKWTNHKIKYTMSENVTTKCVIGEVRLSYVHIFKPEAVEEGGEKKYSASIIIPKSDTQSLTKVKEAIRAAAQAGKAKLGNTPKERIRLPLRDGDLERPDDDAYANSFFINANSSRKPGIVEKQIIDGKPALVEITNEEKVYSGCYAYVSLNFFAYANRGNVGIGAGLNNVLKARDGEFLGGRVSAQTDFAGIDLNDLVGDMPEEDDVI